MNDNLEVFGIGVDPIRESVARHLCELVEGNPDGGTVRPAWVKWLPEADAVIDLIRERVEQGA